MVDSHFVLRARWLLWGEFDPTALAPSLPMSTGTVWHRGEVRRVDRSTGEQRLHDDFGWTSVWKDWPGVGLEDLIEYFLDRVEKSPPDLDHLLASGAVESELAVVLELFVPPGQRAATPSVALDVGLLGRLARAQLGVDIDLYGNRVP